MDIFKSVRTFQRYGGMRVQHRVLEVRPVVERDELPGNRNLRGGGVHRSAGEYCILQGEEGHPHRPGATGHPGER